MALCIHNVGNTSGMNTYIVPTHSGPLSHKEWEGDPLHIWDTR